MSDENRKVSKIVDEITTFYLNKGSKDLDVSINDLETKFKISFKIYDSSLTECHAKELSETLNQPRQPEIETYYWALTGESDAHSELHIVGIMVEKAEVELKSDHLSIIIYKNK